MKVQVSLELTDAQRIAVGLIETGQMAPASRAEVRDYATNIVMASINTATAVTEGLRTKAAAEVRSQLGLPPAEVIDNE